MVDRSFCGLSSSRMWKKSGNDEKKVNDLLIESI